jgi:hypothetical protein
MPLKRLFEDHSATLAELIFRKFDFKPRNELLSASPNTKCRAWERG